MSRSKSDTQLKADIEAELLADPRINAAQVGVRVEDGAVSLLGTVDTYAEKRAAEQAARRVFGVRAVAQDLTVKLLPLHVHSDAEIAAATLHALTWDVVVPRAVTAEVQRGIVTLSGQVDWNFQRDAAESAVRHLTGVVFVQNDVSLKPRPSSTRLEDDITDALQRQATSDARAIHVALSGGRVTLTGSVSSWQAATDAANAVWAAPGVTQVIDLIERSTPVAQPHAPPPAASR